MDYLALQAKASMASRRKIKVSKSMKIFWKDKQ